MKRVLLIILSLSLTGCFYQSIESSSLKRAEAFCKNELGISKLTADFLGGEHVVCLSGASTRVANIKLNSDGTVSK